MVKQHRLSFSAHVRVSCRERKDSGCGKDEGECHTCFALMRLDMRTVFCARAASEHQGAFRKGGRQ